MARTGITGLALVALLLAVFAASALAADVQVVCEPGLRVYLDGNLIGTSSAKEDGLAIAGVREGKHVVRVEKAGFAPQSFEVQVEQLPIEVKVGEFAPAPPAPESAPTAVVRPAGNLVIISVPQNCDIEIDGKAELKTIPVLRIEGLAVGDHTVTFSRPGYNPISKPVWIGPGTEVTIRGDLKAGKVETLFEGDGELQVISTPKHIAVKFLGKTYDKTDLKMNVTHVPAGKYRLEASWAGRDLATDILILTNQRTVVTISFPEGAEPFVITYLPE